MKRFCKLFFLLLGLALMLGQVLGWADDDHEEARRLKESGQILPLQDIIKKAQQERSGRVIEVELEKEAGRHVYEVELLDAHGEVWEFYFDAATGELVKRERDLTRRQ